MWTYFADWEVIHLGKVETTCCSLGSSWIHMERGIHFLVGSMIQLDTEQWWWVQSSRTQLGMDWVKLCLADNMNQKASHMNGKKLPVAC